MDALKAIQSRRSVRKYKNDPVPDELLKQILEAGRSAPSWANFQPSFVIVVKDPAVKEKLSATCSQNNPAINAVKNAPIVLALGYKNRISGYYKDQARTPNGDYGFFDAGLASANITIAACSLGLGTVHVAAIDVPLAAKLLEIPSDHTLVELIPLGFPDHEPKPTPRKPLDQFVHMEKFKI